MRFCVAVFSLSNLYDYFMNSNSLSIRYALAFRCALTFAHRNLCAFGER